MPLPASDAIDRLEESDDSVVLWVPRDEFSIDGITYAPPTVHESGYGIYLRTGIVVQPMITLKEINNDEDEDGYPHWDAAYTASEVTFNREKSPFREWRDLEWDPDITL